MIGIVNNSKQNKLNITNHKVFHSLNIRIAAEDSLDSEPVMQWKITDGQNQRKTKNKTKHEAETCWNNSSVITVIKQQLEFDYFIEII